MKIYDTFIASFAVFIFYWRISASHPFQMHKTQYDERRRVFVSEEPNIKPNMNWTADSDQIVYIATLENNKDHKQTPSNHPTLRTERRETRTNARINKQKCIHDFCEEVENYPEGLIKKVLSQNNVLDAYFKEAEVVFELNNRGGFDEEEDSGDTMCPVKSVTMYPKTAKNIKKEDRILVNVEGHRQGIVFETCLDNAKCKFSESFPAGFTSSCKQKYVRRSLAVLDNQNTAWDTFEVPSCCVCVIKR